MLVMRHHFIGCLIHLSVNVQLNEHHEAILIVYLCNLVTARKPGGHFVVPSACIPRFQSGLSAYKIRRLVLHKKICLLSV